MNRLILSPNWDGGNRVFVIQEVDLHQFSSETLFVLNVQNTEKNSNKQQHFLPPHLDRYLDETFDTAKSLKIDAWHSYLAAEGVE